MSQDSMVSSLPSNGWSCETLGRGVTAAAAMAGLALQPDQLNEVLLGGNSGSNVYSSVYICLDPTLFHPLLHDIYIPIIMNNGSLAFTQVYFHA